MPNKIYYVLGILWAIVWLAANKCSLPMAVASGAAIIILAFGVFITPRRELTLTGIVLMFVSALLEIKIGCGLAPSLFLLSFGYCLARQS